MSRMRSPSYPSVPLKQAIDLVSKIHRSCRSNIITRENAVHEMGYSGLTGRSMKVLSALLQFGLLEKAGTGDVKVTQRTVDILHGIDESDRNEATLEAAYAPQLFRDIHERFPDGIPSQGVIRSYLIQQDFVDVAISPAITAFMETYRSVEHIRESGQHVDKLDDIADASDQNQAVPIQNADTPLTQTLSAPFPARSPAVSELNKINLDIRGDQVSISGLLNSKGLELLEKKIAALKMLLAVYADANDVGGEGGKDSDE
jgi:hypothetical protein